MGLKERSRKPRVLVAKIGLDGHSRGAYVISHGLRHAGMEVIYTGLRQSPAAVARAAVQEDVDVIGISSMVGAHVSVARKLARELAACKASDIPVIMGGIIPEEDMETLSALGVKKLFSPGSRVQEVAEFIYSLLGGAAWVPEVPGSLTGTSINDLQLLGSRCQQCGRNYFPARRNCPRCLTDKVDEVALNRQGSLHTFVVASVAPPGYEVPHTQGYIDLEDGPRIFSLLTDYEKEEDLRTGCDMVLKIVKIGQNKGGKEVVGFRFRPL